MSRQRGWIQISEASPRAGFHLCESCIQRAAWKKKSSMKQAKLWSPVTTLWTPSKANSYLVQLTARCSLRTSRLWRTGSSKNRSIAATLCRRLQSWPSGTKWALDRLRMRSSFLSTLRSRITLKVYPKSAGDRALPRPSFLLSTFHIRYFIIFLPFSTFDIRYSSRGRV